MPGPQFVINPIPPTKAFPGQVKKVRSNKLLCLLTLLNPEFMQRGFSLGGHGGGEELPPHDSASFIRALRILSQ